MTADDGTLASCCLSSSYTGAHCFCSCRETDRESERERVTVVDGLLASCPSLWFFFERRRARGREGERRETVRAAHWGAALYFAALALSFLIWPPSLRPFFFPAIECTKNIFLKTWDIYEVLSNCSNSCLQQASDRTGFFFSCL